jgi:extracellular factor (EF) 3-hydroxypalmitic acid methyl ester biosynthesis protein
MNTVENVIQLTDSVRAFLDRLNVELNTALRPWTYAFSSGPTYLTKVEQWQEDVLQKYNPMVTEYLDGSYASLTELDACLSPDERVVCQAYHRALVQPFFLQSQFVRRALDKPLGYAGDYVVNEMLFENKHSGASPLAKLLSYYALNNGPARAHRDRMPWAHDFLWKRAHSVTQRPMRVLSFACGPEHVLREFAAQGAACEITLCDADSRALEYCRREFKKVMRKTGTNLPLHYVELSAYSLLKEPDKVELLQPLEGQGYDMILVLGLLDYLSAQAVDKLVDILTTTLQPGGEILLTNVHQCNPWRSFMEYVGEWHVIERGEDEFSKLVMGNPPRFRNIELLKDASGTNLYLAGRK